jgi:hypothetical protein
MNRTLTLAALALAVLGAPAFADTAQEELQPGWKRVEATSYQPREAVPADRERSAQDYRFLTDYNP